VVDGRRPQQLPKSGEQFGHLVLSEPHARVLHLQSQQRLDRIISHIDGDEALISKLDGVSDQVHQDLFESPLIANQRGDERPFAQLVSIPQFFVLDRDTQFYSLLIGLGLEDGVDELDDARDIEFGFGESEAALFEHAKVEEVVDEATEELQLVQHDLAVLHTGWHFRDVDGHVAQYSDDLLEEEDYGQDRRAHFVTHCGCKVLRLLHRLLLLELDHAVELVLDFLGAVADVESHGGPPQIRLLLHAQFEVLYLVGTHNIGHILRGYPALVEGFLRRLGRFNF